MPDSHHDSDLTLTLDWPEITLDRLSRMSGLWSDLIREVSREIGGRAARRGLRWVIEGASYGSPFTVTVHPKRISPKVDPAVIRRISGSVIDGVSHVTRKPKEAPPNFSSAALGSLRKLAQETTTKADRFTYVSNGHDDRVAVGARVVEAVNELFGPVTESIGSVEGRLEGVFTHGGRRFYIYDSLTNSQVRCNFGDRISLQEIFSGFEHRVTAVGVVKARAGSGEKISVDVHELRHFPDDSTLTPTDRILELWRQAI